MSECRRRRHHDCDERERRGVLGPRLPSVPGAPPLLSEAATFDVCEVARDEALTSPLLDGFALRVDDLFA